MREVAMRRLVRASLAGAVATLVLSATAYAQQKTKEEYKSTAEIKTLVQQPVPGAEGKQLTILHVSAPPEWVGGKHYHTGPVYVYILKGPFTVDEEGKGTQVFKTGQVYEEPIGEPMQAKNTNADARMEMLVVQISDAGEPLMYKAE
jgi:quercetin dioxygenase-like cupin family protein